MKQDGFLNKGVSAITGMNPQTIAYYSNHGLVIPSISIGKGRGSNRLYSTKDVVKFLLIKELANMGLSLVKIKAVFEQLKQEFGPSSPMLRPDEFHRVFIGIYDLHTDFLTAKAVPMADPNKMKKYYKDNPVKKSEKLIDAARIRLENFQVDMFNHSSFAIIDITAICQAAGL